MSGSYLQTILAVRGRATEVWQALYGGVLFGVGWAFSCTCPVPALAMVFSAAVLGIPVVAGLFSGILLGDRRAPARPRAAVISTAARPAS